MFVLFILGVLADTKRCNYLSVLQDAWQFITERFTKSLNIMGFVPKNIVAASLLTKNRTQLVSSNMQKKNAKKKKNKTHTQGAEPRKKRERFL